MSLFGGIGNAISGGGLANAGLFALPGYAESQNYKMQQEQYDYQRDLQQKMMEREDNAVTRRVADLQRAGLSPTLAAGSAASAGPVVSTSAPQRERTPLLESAMGVMQMLKQKKDISRTEAEIDNIKAQTDKTRVSTIAESADAKTRLATIAANLGFVGARTQQANASTSTLRSQARRIEQQTLGDIYELGLAQNAGVSQHPGVLGSAGRDIFGDLFTGQRNRAGRSNLDQIFNMNQEQLQNLRRSK